MYLYEIAKGAAEVLLSPYLLGVMVLAGLALATGAAGRVAVRIEDLVNGAAAVRQTNNNRGIEETAISRLPTRSGRPR